MSPPRFSKTQIAEIRWQTMKTISPDEYGTSPASYEKFTPSPITRNPIFKLLLNTVVFFNSCNWFQHGFDAQDGLGNELLIKRRYKLIGHTLFLDHWLLRYGLAGFSVHFCQVRKRFSLVPDAERAKCSCLLITSSITSSTKGGLFKVCAGFGFSFSFRLRFQSFSQIVT